MIPNGISTREIANNVFPTPVSLPYPTSVGRDIMRSVWKTDNYSLTVCDQYKSITYDLWLFQSRHNSIHVHHEGLRTIFAVPAGA